MDIGNKLKILQDRVIELEAAHKEMVKISVKGLKVLNNYKLTLQVAYSAIKKIQDLVKPDILVTIDPAKRQIMRITDGALTDMNTLLSLVK